MTGRAVRPPASGDVTVGGALLALYFVVELCTALFAYSPDPEYDGLRPWPLRALLSQKKRGGSADELMQPSRILAAPGIQCRHSSQMECADT